ncbi:bacillithiol biosynthesis cysteine-adding enzyme BshC [Ferruginibacter albus]|uniref:bacillithiol biosynthesis cysteine-adding enzyme BshC n=1 Tax=Ferruginibacter albus TaxID=2875540 RepID=UPI001CC405EC|nr:bacillithiol biosynthesis cysteine-adding enzyme BshC [Ferruginibacter albus]UAY52964.1 bacillithiol biosynthesis cysteine-adding enzyme BshC [Ferruginibacter albus]
MSISADCIKYEQTGYFGKLVTDYISANESIQPFYNHPVSIDGIRTAIAERKKFNTGRNLLVTELKKQYTTVETSQQVNVNIDLLLSENTFTITTAHQPNIFTGPLYFMYKILHVIKIAASLQQQLPQYKFVPVYYMGSEDADLEELNHIYINGEKYEWKTDQTGAVGRMKVDKNLLKLIEQMEGRLLVYPFGKEVIDIVRSSYKEGTTIEQSTFTLVNKLFAEYGLVVLLPDNAALKKAFIPIVEKELKENFSHKSVAETISKFPHEYKVQAAGREINLFYLKDDKRERIEAADPNLQAEIKEHPERFSPNVILRPVFQELILPNILFVGGGGEIGYWLELKKVFEAAGVPYPILTLRNSFLLICKERSEQVDKLKLSLTDLFKSEIDLLNELVKRETSIQLSLSKEKEQLINLYKNFQNLAGKADVSLMQHTEALQTKALKKIDALEKKMLKAEKKKFEAEQRHLHKLKSQLFPNNNLQERIDNGLCYYAKYGKEFIQRIYNYSLTLEQEFTVLTEE